MNASLAPRDAEPTEPIPTARAASSMGGARRHRKPSATLRVQVVFHAVDEQRAQAIAAELIDRAHELANEPANECDVDVSVQLTSEHSGADASRAL